MSFRQAQLANSLKVLPCPQHPGGLWCTPVTAVSSASRERFLPTADHVCSVPGPHPQAGCPLSEGRNRLAGISSEKSKNTTSPAVVPAVTQGNVQAGEAEGTLCASAQTPAEGQPGLRAELTSPWACGCFLCVSGPFLRSQAAASLPGLFGAILPVSVNPGGPGRRIRSLSQKEKESGGPGSHLRVWDSAAWEGAWRAADPAPNADAHRQARAL